MVHWVINWQTGSIHKANEMAVSLKYEKGCERIIASVTRGINLKILR